MTVREVKQLVRQCDICKCTIPDGEKKYYRVTVEQPEINVQGGVSWSDPFVSVHEDVCSYCVDNLMQDRR